jgi:hypothetical protein
LGISKAKRDRQRDNRRKGGESLVKLKVSRELSCKTLDNTDTNKYIDNLKSSSGRITDLSKRLYGSFESNNR